MSKQLSPLPTPNTSSHSGVLPLRDPVTACQFLTLTKKNGVNILKEFIECLHTSKQHKMLLSNPAYFKTRVNNYTLQMQMSMHNILNMESGRINELVDYQYSHKKMKNEQVRIHFCTQSIANIKISVEPIFKYLHPRIRLSAMETARTSESIKIELRNKAGLWFAISVSSFLFLCSFPPHQWILLLQ